jgi:hypothetical protein
MTTAKKICSAMGTLHWADEPFAQNLFDKSRLEGRPEYPLFDEHTVQNQSTGSRQNQNQSSFKLAALAALT